MPVTARGLVVSASASVLVGQSDSLPGFTKTFQDLVNWVCSLFTRRTVGGRVAGTIQKAKIECSDIRPCKNSVVVLQTSCCHIAPPKRYIKTLFPNQQTEPD